MSESKQNAIDATIAHHPSPGEQYYPKFEVTPELDAAADKLIAQYPEDRKQSAVLPILHEIQKRFGYLCGDSIVWTGEKIGSSAAHVLGVVTFYPGLRQQCPGKFHIRVCRTLACAMAGSEDLVNTLCEKLGIDRSKLTPENPIGVSSCGQWSIEFVECLANCGGAPNVMVNEHLHQNITPDKADELIGQYKNA
ncbi:MAG: NAD(P)H-dependent oxidoreductase subunit E [Akkermansia sp.]